MTLSGHYQMPIDLAGPTRPEPQTCVVPGAPTDANASNTATCHAEKSTMDSSNSAVSRSQLPVSDGFPTLRALQGAD
jgi:hypothetical protein